MFAPATKSSAFILSSLWVLVGLALPLAASPEQEQFEKKIRPLLLGKCIECHGQDQQAGGLRLDSKEGWLTGGATGPAVQASDAEGSLLLQVLSDDSHKAIALSKNEIHELKLWIQAGAFDPRVNTNNWQNLPNADRAKGHWSFKAVQKSTPATLTESDWARSTIDQFIVAAQKEAGLNPVADASKEQLVRRIYFALIGLPPTPEQIDAFVNDSRPDVFERVVDELLASPHFGERWGRHWLDVARFAESSGGGRTLLFKDAWRFRDYVIKAFNDDMPFDQLIREQLAGDLLPYEDPKQRSRQLTATAFLALGPTNYEQQDKQLLRYDVIDEQIDTIGKAFMGMTLGCARCHDHKFDPVPTSDYYALAGIFKSTRTLFNYTDNVARWVATPLPLEGQAAKEMAEAEMLSKQLTPKLTFKKNEQKLCNQHTVNVPSPGLPKSSRSFPGIILDERSAEVEGDWLFSQFFQNYIGEGYYHDGDSSKGEASLTFRPKIPIPGLYDIRIAYSPAATRSSKTPITIRHAGGETEVLMDQRDPLTEYGRFRSIGQFELEPGDHNFLRITNKDTDGYVVVDAVQWFLIDDTDPESPESKQYYADLKNEIVALEKELKPISAKLKSRPLAMTVKEDPEPTDSAIRIRGIKSRKGEVVPRGFLQVATLGEAPSIPDSTSGRLELAEWMVSPDNPLTSRVIANRIWTWLFGAGLVRSVDNFGTTGESPSHPELLDYLAARVHDNDWSIKAMVREIVLSRTWQLSTLPDEEAVKLDPDNRLLLYYPRRRLDAEQLRDAILAVNGNLDLTMFGPNIDGAGEINANNTAAQNVEYNYVFKDTRRSVYTPAFRVKRHELFELFDFGNINFSLGQRNVSTVALQALYLLNNPFVLEQSRDAAKNLLKQEKDPEGRLNTAFLQTLGRTPSAQERTLISGYLQDGLSSESVEEWSSVFQTLFGTIDFRYLQ